jgi:hypothetical protein
MAVKTKKLRDRVLPYLGLYIDIPLLAVKTVLFRQSFEMFTYEWVRLQIRIWKWSFEFNLYSPERHYILNNPTQKAIMYYRLDDDLYNLLKKASENHKIYGVDWDGSRNIGFYVEQPPTTGGSNA